MLVVLYGALFVVWTLMVWVATYLWAYADGKRDATPTFDGEKSLRRALREQYLAMAKVHAENERLKARLGEDDLP